MDSQLNLFDEAQNQVEMIIPHDLISPIESAKGVNTKEFKKQKERWTTFVRSIQNYHDCSWYDARNLLIKHRDQQEPLTMEG